MAKKRPALHLFRFADEFLTFWEGQVIFEEGHMGGSMYVVKKGTVELRVGGKPVENVEAGGILGEMALIEKKPRSATAVAKTDCELVEVDEQQFKYLVQQTPYFAIEVMRIMADRLREMDKQIQGSDTID